MVTSPTKKLWVALNMPEVLLAEAVGVVEVKTQTLPSVLTDYLDNLLQSATEIPEASLESFRCLRFKARAEYLVPISRIRRINLDQQDLVQPIPGEAFGGRYSFQQESPGHRQFMFDELIGLETVFSSDVQWRATPQRVPWFIGTHTTLLCRIFDPNLLSESP